MTSRPNVLVVVVDTVRADRVSMLGYERETTPNLDDFAADATVYADAITQGSWSVPAHASLLTGKYPRAHGATTVNPVLREQVVLPELLREAGYSTYAYSPNEYVRPATGFARGFDVFRTDSRVTEPTVTADLVGPVANWITSTAPVRRPLEWLFNRRQKAEALANGPAPPREDTDLHRLTGLVDRASEPFFLFANLIDAHLPRSPAPAYVDEFVDPTLADAPLVTNERAHNVGEVPLGRRSYERLSQLYDADLRTLDEKLGAFLDHCREAGVLADSLVVVLSDHGEHVGEFGLVGHQFSLFENVVSVPLVVQYPEGGPDRIEAQVETRRLFETVLDETGVVSFPERTLASGRPDEIARGAYHSPMIDLGALLRGETPGYDPTLLGEALTVARTPSEKLLSFDDEELLCSLPGEKRQAPSDERVEDLRRQLRDGTDTDRGRSVDSV